LRLAAIGDSGAIPGGALSGQAIVARAEAVRQRLGERAHYLARADWERFTCKDLALLFDLYDELFFERGLAAMLEVRGAVPKFGLSRRMTRAGGRTRAHLGAVPPRFEIVVSSYLLELSFADLGRPVVVNGVSCADRVEAAMRVFEHELVHLVEFLRWGASSCGRRRFRRLARELFGHTARGHRLVTQAERARELYGVRVGDRVAFDCEGRRLGGMVNRITKRATVLVPNRRGVRYSDGRRYLKYYVPLEALDSGESE
jgi:hypothetical protein